LFSFTLIYIFVRFLLLIPLISQPILHILSPPFPLYLYSMSFYFHSLLFIFFLQYFCLSFPTPFFPSSPQYVSFCSCRYLISSSASNFNLLTFFFLSDFLPSQSFLFISQSSSLASRCSTFLILPHSPFVVPSVCYPHFLFPHSSHSFRILPPTICQHLYRDLKSCLASVGPPP
jgi:hypothetical protein